MQLTTLLPLLAILICPITMGIMMWKMKKNMDAHSSHQMHDRKHLPGQLEQPPVKKKQPEYEQ